ncbi:MAG: glycosyl hydrolase, partial [Terracidiphilus sp.]
MRTLWLALLFAASAFAFGQSNPPAAPPIWQMQESGTSAGLRGIDSVDGTVAWASGTNGTVLKTIDGGAHWTACAVPDAAKDGATLDFRGVQAWDATTAIVMASGKGKLSRLYKTKDGCKTWKLIFMNPDKDGFWDALYFESYGDSRRFENEGYLLGDPVNGKFTIFVSRDSGKSWIRQKCKGLEADTT